MHHHTQNPPRSTEDASRGALDQKTPRVASSSARARTLLIIGMVVVLACSVIHTACSDSTAESSAPDYLAWTASDWDRASDEERKLAARAMLEDVTGSLVAAVDPDGEASAAIADEITSEHVDETVTEISDFFEASGSGTIGDLAAMTKDLLGVS